MLDPATFRRIKPNYQFSSIKPPDPDLLSNSESEHSTSSRLGSEEDSDGETDSEPDPFTEPTRKQAKRIKADLKKHFKKKLYRDEDESEQIRVIEVYVPDPAGDGPKTLEALDNARGEGEDAAKPSFTDEDYLTASPVTLGFSFGEKLWLEFSVAGISDIRWNEDAFDSLIIPDDQKTVVRALVESHAWEAKCNIDDVIRGKGRGLVAVLHGVSLTHYPVPIAE